MEENKYKGYTPDYIDALLPKQIFVFGSNALGYHTGGASGTARKKFGAVWGQAEGLQGQCYAIPVDYGKNVRKDKEVKEAVERFIAFAKANPDLFFLVTRVGCGIAGYHDEEIAQFFVGALELKNVSLPKSFVDALGGGEAHYDLERFVEAQQLDYVSALNEVKEGEKIVDTGEVVTSEIADKLRSMVIEMERNGLNRQETQNLQIGQALVVLILIILFTCYLILFRNNYFSKPRHILMLYAMILVYPIIVSILVRHQHTLNSVYLLPFAIVPLLTRVFLDTRTAFITHVIMILICSLAVSYRFEFIIVEITGGLAAIYALSDLSKRAHLFSAAFIVAICTAAMYYAVQLIQNDEMIPIDSTIYLIFLINGILLLLTYPMMFVIEKFFGFTSVVTLFELSDSSRGLLLKLSEVAPGTFTHSTTVGNLAYEIANKIGANGLLVRTGALYHDIGKMSNPVFFTENQAGINPHDKLTEIESAQIIIDHVKEGQRLAEKYNLPSNIKDFILTHHGQGVAKYFFLKYQKDHSNEEIDKSLFSYPGPNPFTREQAILMMTDSVEAASHSLKEYSDEAIRTLVNRIIDTQVNEGYFTECPITFLDIATAKQVLIDRLKSIYHTRIQYPGQEQPKENEGKESRLKRKKKRRGRF